MNLFPSLTSDIEARLIRVARIRQPLRRLAWRNAVREAINTLSRSASVVGAACDAKAPAGLLNTFPAGSGALAGRETKRAAEAGGVLVRGR